MVRIVAVSTLGYDNYGGYFSDREVDGVDYSDTRVDSQVEQDQPKSYQVPKVSKAVKLKGGRKSQ